MKKKILSRTKKLFANQNEEEKYGHLKLLTINKPKSPSGLVSVIIPTILPDKKTYKFQRTAFWITGNKSIYGKILEINKTQLKFTRIICRKQPEIQIQTKRGKWAWTKTRKNLEDTQNELLPDVQEL